MNRQSAWITVVALLLCAACAVLWLRLSALEADHAAMKAQVAEIHGVLTRRGGPGGAPPLPSQPIALAGSPTRGRRDAKLALIEYSDFQCPACAMFVRGTLPRFDQEYVATGKVLLVFKHLPLTSIHPRALQAAEASECAARQGKFWEMHDRLFADQRSLDEPSLIGRASVMGLNVPAFTACLQSGVPNVREDMNAASQLRIGGTPTFLIGALQPDGSVKVTMRTSGAIPFDALKSILDPMLEEAPAR